MLKVIGCSGSGIVNLFTIVFFFYFLICRANPTTAAHPKNHGGPGSWQGSSVCPYSSLFALIVQVRTCKFQCPSPTVDQTLSDGETCKNSTNSEIETWCGTQEQFFFFLRGIQGKKNINLVSQYTLAGQ